MESKLRKKSLPYQKKKLRAKIKHCAPCKIYKEKCNLFYLNKDEISALKVLLKNNDLIMQKSDKGNSIVLINKRNYLALNIQYLVIF